MLQIIIFENQPDQQGTTFTELDLYPGTKIDIIWENPLFLFDEIAAMFSLSFNLPTTPKNLLLFGYPDRIPIICGSVKYNALIKHSGLQIASGEIILFQFNKDIQTQFVGSVEITKLPLSKLDMGVKEFDVVAYTVASFGENTYEPNYQNPEWDTYRNAAVNHSKFNPDNDFFIGPVKLKDTDWQGHPGTYGIKNSLIQYLNFFNARENSFQLGEPDKSHTPVIPFLTVRKVIDSIFGDELFENPFAFNDLQRLVIISAGHKNYNTDLFQTSSVFGSSPSFMGWYEDLQIREFLLPVNEFRWISQAGQGGNNLTWNYANFLNNYASNEFLKDIFKIFSMTLFRVGRKFHMEFNNDIFDRDVWHSWDDFLHEKPSVIREGPMNYRFNYSTSGKEFKENVQEFSSWAEVYQAAVDSQPNQEFFYKVTDNPQILSITKEFRGESGDIWLTSKSAKSALDSDEDLQYEESINVSSKVKPLEMNIEHYWWQNHKVHFIDTNSPGIVLEKGHWHVPVIDNTSKDSAPSIMLFAGRKPTFASAEGSYEQLLPPAYLVAPVNNNIIEIQFTDQNNFTGHNGYSRGYTIEYKTDSDIYGQDYWFLYKQIYPGIDWQPPATIYESIPLSSFNGTIIQIRIYAFSGTHASPISAIAPNGTSTTQQVATTNNVDEYPYLTNHHTDHIGVKQFYFSLLPDTTDGIIEIFHDKMKLWCEQDKIKVNALFKLSPEELVKIDMRDKVLLHGKSFFIEKLQFTLHTNHISKTYASLISCLPPETTEP